MGAAICSRCCGAKRRVEIDCPEDCAFLVGAHAGGWEGRTAERERDARRIGPHLDGLTEAQGRLVLLALVGVTAIRARRTDLDDRMLHDAVEALRKTAETRLKGIHYEHPAESAAAQGLAHELSSLFEARDGEGAPRSPSDRDLAAALAALGRSIGATVREGAGPHAFLDTAARTAGRLAPRPSTRSSAPIILEP
jgi:hypothetical protein